MSDQTTHWDKVYGGRPDDTLSWFVRLPALSLALIESCGIGRDAAVIDIGGGASTLTDALLQQGYSDLWLLDISATALAVSRRRLGADAERIRWVESDVVHADLPESRFDLWHDRAVFHFFVDPAERKAYVKTALRAVKPGGSLIMATFAEDGPEQCSGLPVARYDADSLAAQFGDACELLATEKEAHRTPAGKVQQFRYCVLRRRDV
jgi:ubiquinone/menaquinone biosynthesis C-methylase UbiE